MKKETYEVVIQCMDEGISYIEVTGTDVNGNEINFDKEEYNLVKAANKVGLSGFAFGANKMALLCTYPEVDDIAELLNIFSFIRNGGDAQHNITLEEFKNRSKVDGFDLRLPDIYFDNDGEEVEVVFEESDYTDKVDLSSSFINDENDADGDEDEDYDEDEDEDEDENFIDYIFIAQLREDENGRKELSLGCMEEEWTEGLCFDGYEDEIERYISTLGTSIYKLDNDGFSLVVKVDSINEDAIKEFCENLFYSVYDGVGKYEVDIRYL